ncbi:hypothetical protein JCM6882_005386 [Rhodosporidiobolus microsporus]
MPTPSTRLTRRSSPAPSSTSSDLTPPLTDEPTSAPSPATSERPSSAPAPQAVEVAHRPCLPSGTPYAVPAVAPSPPKKRRKLRSEKGKEKEEKQLEQEEEEAVPAPSPELTGVDELLVAAFQLPPTLDRDPSPDLAPPPPSPPPIPHPPPPLLPFPTFPRPPPTKKQVMAREAREAWTKVITFGAEAPLEKIKIGGANLASLYIDLMNCDASYLSSSSPSLLASFPALPPPSSAPQVDFSSTLTPTQAHAALSAYFRALEPSLLFFTSPSARLGFQEKCLDMWAGEAAQGAEASGGVDAAEKGKKLARPRGWWSMYLATVALGLMAMDEADAHGVVLPQEEIARRDLARGLAEEAARGLGSLRAALLLVTFDLGGLTGMPDVSSALSSLPLLVGAAYELGLNREPGEGEEADEKRGLWWRVFELEAAWSPLLDKRLSLSPFSFTTRPPLVSSSTSPPSPSPLHSTLLLSSKLSCLLNSPHSPTPLDLVPLVDEYEQLVRSSAAAGGGDGLEGLVRKCAGVRLRAVRNEIGERAGEEEEKAWKELTYDLFTTPPDLVLRIDRFQQLLAATTLLHALVLLALRLSLTASPSPTLAAVLPTLLSTLKTAPWPMHLHRTVRRGIVVLEHLLPTIVPPLPSAA